jgi:hypothetical protein
MPYTNFPQVQEIIDAVNQDVRQQLSGGSTTNPGLGILIDYTNRIHKQVLRFSRWTFLLSDPLYFLTDKGQSQYWLGPHGEGTAGTVDTGLNLTDVDKIKKDSVVDISNLRALKWLSASPFGPNLNDSTGKGREGQPAVFVQNPNEPNIFQIYPPPNNQNIKTPSPQVPIVVTAPGGALALRMYIVKVTYVDELGGESTTTDSSALVRVGAGQLARVKSPVLPFPLASSGVKYNRYNVYASVAQLSSTGVLTNEGSETLQNVSPITIGTDFFEPGTGLTIIGAQPPVNSTLQPLGAYLIKFQYYKNRATLRDVNDFLQVPEDYKDVIIQGVNALVYKLLDKKDEAMSAHQLYRSGLTEMVWDKNLFPEGVEFIRPDANSYVNTQILGYLPPFF